MVRLIVLSILRDGISFLSIRMFSFPFLSSFFFLVPLVVLYIFIIFPFTIRDKIWQEGWGVLQDSKIAAPPGTANIDASDAVGT